MVVVIIIIVDAVATAIIIAWIIKKIVIIERIIIFIIEIENFDFWNQFIQIFFWMKKNYINLKFFPFWIILFGFKIIFIFILI